MEGAFAPLEGGPPERRNLADSDCWSWLRQRLFEKAARRAGSVEELEREVFRVAAGGEEGCRLVRDQLRAPGAREKKQLLLEAMDRKERPFSIVGDIKKAHRRWLRSRGFWPAS